MLKRASRNTHNMAQGDDTPGKRAAANTLPPQLICPRRSRYCVENPNLSAWLDDCLEASLILLIAPAGFGKTTAMQTLHDTLKTGGQHTAWVQITRDENQLERFCAAIEQACGLNPGPQKSETATIDAPFASPTRGWQLVERIACLREDTAIFLDDFENINEANILATLQRLIERLPPGCRMFIASRVQPALKLARLKTQGRLLQIGVAEMVFDLEQARIFLNLRHHLGLSDPLIEQLLQRTEGWPAGLQLAALALSARHDRDKATFIANVSRLAVDIGEYLYEEVFSTQTEEIQQFLLHTAVLGRLNAALCAAVSGMDAPALLRQMEQHNLFLLRLDEAATEYRYHPLFAEFLQRKLAQDAPQHAAALHRRAARWYEQQGDLSAALEHALLADDTDLACALLTATVWQTLGCGHVDACRRWFAALPPAALKARPLLRVAQSWAAIFAHDYATAIEIVEELRAEPVVQDSDYFRVLAPMSLGLMDKVTECAAALAARTGDCAVGSLPHSTMMNVRAFVLLCEQRFAAAEATAQQALAEFKQLGSAYGAAFSCGFIAHSALAQGQVERALALLTSAFHETAQQVGRHHTCTAHLAAYLAEAQYESGAFDAAFALINEFFELIVTTGMVDALIICHRLRARGHCRAGRWSDAEAIIAQGARLGESLQLPRLTAAMQLELIYRQIVEFDNGGANSLRHLAVEPLPAIWQSFAERLAPANDVEQPLVFALRLDLRCQRADAALARLPALIAKSAQHGRQRLRCKLELLRCLALAAIARRTEAHEALAQLLAADAAGVSTACIVDEGPPASALLQELADRGLPQTARLIAQLTQNAPERTAGAALAHRPPSPPSAAEPRSMAKESLSEREKEILRRLAAGLPNKKIAVALDISETTVKFHLRNINAKLAAKNRTHAVFIGRSQGWID